MVAKIARWTNPHNIDLSSPYLYFIRVRSPDREYRYVGKASAKSRMNAYWSNVEKVHDRKTKRPAVKGDGSPQKKGNVQFRYVHLVLAVADKNGWQIDHFPLENCSEDHLDKLETERIIELGCDMNNGASWDIEDFERLAMTLE